MLASWKESDDKSRQHIKKERHPLMTKVRIVQAMDFPVVMYQCDIWTIKKDVCQRIDAFELWCCGRLLRVHWTVKGSNESILKEISPEYSLEGLLLQWPMLWPPDVKSQLTGEDPDAGRD